MTHLAHLGCCLGIALGLLGLLAPRRALTLVGLALRPDAPHGISEVRATYGGLFLGMESALLLGGDPRWMGVGAAAWLGAAGARLLSMAIDRRVGAANIRGVVVEATIGLLHAAPSIAAAI
jgi:hypothetical protein